MTWFDFIVCWLLVAALAALFVCVLWDLFFGGAE
jgi:hypothetical protein